MRVLANDHDWYLSAVLIANSYRPGKHHEIARTMWIIVISDPQARRRAIEQYPRVASHDIICSTTERPLSYTSYLLVLNSITAC